MVYEESRMQNDRSVAVMNDVDLRETAMVRFHVPFLRCIIPEGDSMRMYVLGTGAAALRLAVLHHISMPFYSSISSVVRFRESVGNAGGPG